MRGLLLGVGQNRHRGIQLRGGNRDPHGTGIGTCCRRRSHRCSSGLCWVSCADCWSSRLPHFDPGPGRWPCCPEGLPAHGRGGQRAVPVHDGRPVPCPPLLAQHRVRGYVAAATIGKTILVPACRSNRRGIPETGRRLGGPEPVECPSFVTLGSRRASRFVAFVVAAVPGLVLGALYGPGTYADAIAVTRVLAIVAGLQCVRQCVLVHAGLARHHWTVWLPWAGATIEIVVIGLWHSGAEQIAADLRQLVFVILVAWSRSRRLPGASLCTPDRAPLQR